MFKFGFSDTEQASEPLESIIEWRKCEEVICVENSFTKDAVKNEHLKTLLFPKFELKYLSHNSIMELLNNYQDLEESSVFEAEKNHSDLLPAFYEGWFHYIPYFPFNFAKIEYIFHTLV